MIKLILPSTLWHRSSGLATFEGQVTNPAWQFLDFLKGSCKLQTKKWHRTLTLWKNILILHGFFPFFEAAISKKWTEPWHFEQIFWFCMDSVPFFQICRCLHCKNPPWKPSWICNLAFKGCKATGPVPEGRGKNQLDHEWPRGHCPQPNSTKIQFSQILYTTSFTEMSATTKPPFLSIGMDQPVLVLRTVNDHTYC